MSKLRAFALLVLRFLIEAALSGLTTARLILVGGRELQPGFARMSYAGLSETGAVVLGVLVTLTPGTTTVDIDPVRRELLLHLLDATQAEDAIAAIRRAFEPRVRVLFGEKR